MIKNLFSSKVLFAVLDELFKADGQSLTTAELVKTTGKNQANIQRELDKLISWDIVLKAQKGRQNHFNLNKHNYFYDSLKKIFVNYHNQQHKYVLLNEESGTCVLSVDYIVRAYVDDYGIKKGVIDKALDSIAVYRNDHGQYYFDKETFERGAKESLCRLLKDPSFVFDTILPESLVQGEEAQKIFKDLYRRNFKIPKTEAIDLFNRFLKIISIQVSLNTIAVFDLKDQVFSNYLKEYLEKKVKHTNLNLSQVLERLLAPEKLTFTQLLRIELLRLALKCKNISSSPIKELTILQSRWGWLNYGYVGPGFDLAYFTQVFEELKQKSVADLKEEIEFLLDNENLVKKNKQKIYRQLEIDLSHQRFISALSLLSYLKIYRKDTAFLIFYSVYKIFSAILPNYKKSDLFNLTIKESQDLLRGRLKISNQELRERYKYCVYVCSENLFFYGSEADKYLKDRTEEETLDASVSSLKMLDGTAACLGKTGNWIYGEVRIINSASDMAKMKEGDILVSVATTPDILPAMKKAAAIVTDHGGITCHAAIVSRELNIPCLIATKYATKVFKDGDRVVVCPRHSYIKFQ
jgi:phosphohistidine swiveling domain-containing protein/ribosomal protein L17